MISITSLFSLNTIIIFSLCFLYFFIPSFVTYFAEANLRKKICFGLLTLVVQSLIVGIAALLASHGQALRSDNFLILLYAEVMSILGIFAAAISNIIERKQLTKDKK